jgi:hypothetical protein
MVHLSFKSPIGSRFNIPASYHTHPNMGAIAI